MFLKNAWYVAAWAEEISWGLNSVRMHGEQIVLFRKPDGTPVALEDACPHRKLPLSKGRLQGDRIECGYHGLTFDCSGRCIRAPGQKAIPPGAFVRAYPTLERWGLVWIWMGAPGRADPARLASIEHYGDPAWGINRGEAIELDCHYLLVTDNLLDPSHVAWVHRDSFGERSCEDTPLKTAATDAGIVVYRWMKDVEVAPFYSSFVRFKGRADRLQRYEVRYPSLAIIEAIFTPAGTGGEGAALHPEAFVMESYNFMTPVDEGRTRYYWFQLRNFAPESAEVSRQMTQAVRDAFEEDRLILNAVQRGMTGSQTPHIDLALDLGPLRFRRGLNQLIAAEEQARGEAKPVT